MNEGDISLHLSQVVESGWGTMLAIEVSAVDVLPEECRDDVTLAASVYIFGDWQGALAVQGSWTHAMAVAEFLIQSGEEPSPGQICDAFGEVANMTAGNLKAVLGTRCVISTPEVQELQGYEGAVPGTDLLVEKIFQSASGPFVVRLFKDNGGMQELIEQGGRGFPELLK